MKKGEDFKYFLALEYPVTIEPILPENGGGFMAYYEQFGKAMVGDGDTKEEALSNLEALKKRIFKEWFEKGIEIPKPILEDDSYSGRFLLRIPKILHAQLAIEAKKNSTSLNKYILYLLTQASTLSAIETKQDSIAYKIDDCLDHFSQYIHSVTANYRFLTMPKTKIYESKNPQPCLEGEEEFSKAS
ncbi:MAG: toxin-antitoxin system HicB family antitoxin [bacterium]|nr:toxin-antitoxin system HicB family antitoxin [bacterium]